MSPKFTFQAGNMGRGSGQGQGTEIRAVTVGRDRN